MKGKEKCKALKELRQKIAESNDISFAVSECSHKGDCKGTCPKCDAELKYLERELDKKRKLGKSIVLAGLSACLTGVVAGCNDEEENGPWNGSETEISSENTVDYDDGLIETEEPSTQEIHILEGDVYISEESTEAEGDNDTTEEIIELEGDVDYTGEDEE